MTAKGSTKARAEQAAIAEAQGTRGAALRMLKAGDARDSLIAFTEFTMPHQADPNDAELSRYSAQYFHKALGAALEAAERGEIPRLIITFPPRHGKSELTSRRFPAWLLGRDPYRHIMLGTYNQPFAEDFGKNVRGIMNTSQFKTVFPNCSLKTGGQASDRLETEAGGLAVFVGRGGSATGRGADVLILDDPVKDRAEANSKVVRDEVWNWFNDTMSTRLMSDTGVIIVIMTRWHEDDLVGRLIDPTNPHYNSEEAAQWKIINIKAIAGDDDILGRQPGEALWPEKFGLDYLEGFKRRNPVGFSALYQQEPTPADGEFFKTDHLLGYRLEDRPGKLRIYAASDHAVSTKQENDRTCLLIVGIDSENVIWILDCFWKRAKADKVVEAMIDLQRKWKPLVWWAESGHISKSIGPFLKRRMMDEGVYINLRDGPVVADKMSRAQSIQARAAMGMVRFPVHAHWCEDARQECLKFPQARHDDFVDALAHVGLGIDIMVRAGSSVAESEKNKGPRVGTMGWVKASANLDKRREQLVKTLGGM